MIVLNFAHPLTPEQREQIEAATGQPIARVIETFVHFDPAQPFATQVQALVDEVPLTAQQWQTEPLLLIPPSLNFLTAVLLAELHGRMGYFIPIVRLRVMEGSLPPRFEVAEVIHLQAVRDAARGRRA